MAGSNDGRLEAESVQKGEGREGNMIVGMIGSLNNTLIIMFDGFEKIS